MTHPHTTIVGGGIVGLSIARELARRGAAVTVLDEGPLADSASAGNAGIVALGHPPLPRPGLVGKAVRWMLDSASPLYIPPRLDPGLVVWLWRFRQACTPKQFERSMSVLASLGHEAGRCIASLIDEESIDCDFRPAGWFEVYATEAAAANGRHEADLLRGAGYEARWLDGPTLCRQEPALSENVLGATHFVESSSVDPGRLLEGLAAAAVRHGAILEQSTRVRTLIRPNGRVTAVETADGRQLPVEHLVLAAGAWSTGLAKAVGVRVPMQPGKGYHVNLPMLDPPLSTACVLTERHIAVTPMSDGMRLAGTVELSGLNQRLHPRRVAMLREGAALYLPGVLSVEASPGWCGLRPCTADGLPVIGWAPGVPNLFLATGHAKMGLTLGPITGRLVAEWLVDGEPSMDLTAMSPQRFAG